jgi:hypothetical protein
VIDVSVGLAVTSEIEDALRPPLAYSRLTRTNVPGAASVPTG